MALCLLAVAALTAGAVPAVGQDAGTGGETLEDGTAASSEEQAAEEDSSDPTVTQEGKLTIRADRSRLKLGQRVTFRGRRQPARQGDRIRLKYRPSGRRSRVVATARTNARGRYEVSAKPRRNGSFVVTSPRRSGKALRSGRETIEVRARVRIRARNHQLRRRGIKVRGSVRPRDRGRRVVLQRQTGKGWQRVKVTRTNDRGAYRFRWKPPSLGAYRLRTRFGGDRLNLGARRALRRPVHVYRKDHASYYGPGFYGNTTACGQTLRRGTVGVAHKRIRCGARVRFHYRGRTRRIPVIDRGPYVAGRRWDLTNAARKELGFPRGTDDIWANR